MPHITISSHARYPHTPTSSRITITQGNIVITKTSAPH